MQTPQPSYVIGDVHGQLKKLLKLLREAHLIGDHSTWQGGNTTLWFLGDLVDRGPDSIGVLNLVMRLQTAATLTGGHVGCLLGNHELLMLGAYQFGRRSTGLSSNFISKWRQNGGDLKDLARLTKPHLDWIAQLPAMTTIGQQLLIHADSPLYLHYGHSVEEVNTTILAILKKSNILDWEELIEDFARRGSFISGNTGETFARRFLEIYGGQQIVHGHTPITAFTRNNPKDISTPFIYAGGQCVNVDGGMFMGGPGFIYKLPFPGTDETSEEVQEESAPEI